MRVITLMVARNEADRYLEPCLAWAETFSSDIVVYDDQSTDGTFQVCLDRGARTAVRPDGVPSFMEHEGRFREAAWRWMEKIAEPGDGDWVFCLDADEFYVDARGEAEGIEEDIQEALALSATAIEHWVPEIFAEAENLLYRRVDGFWGEIYNPRLVKWRPGMSYADKRMASGSLPAGSGRPYRSLLGAILHVGYLDPADRRAKYDRYSGLPGHSSAHVESIIRPETLERWEGPLPFRR